MDKATLKTFLLNISANTDPEKTPEQSVDEFVDALEVFVKSATVTVPGDGLIAPSGGGTVSGTSITGQLS